MTDFFISYTQADRDWAVWIAWVLEAAGFTTKVQDWDFPAGSNFIVEMHEAAAEAGRTIAVLSREAARNELLAVLRAGIGDLEGSTWTGSSGHEDGAREPGGT